jgi:hypothetical protein
MVSKYQLPVPDVLSPSLLHHATKSTRASPLHNNDDLLDIFETTAPAAGKSHMLQ